MTAMPIFEFRRKMNIYPCDKTGRLGHRRLVDLTGKPFCAAIASAVDTGQGRVTRGVKPGAVICLVILIRRISCGQRGDRPVILPKFTQRMPAAVMTTLAALVTDAPREPRRTVRNQNRSSSGFAA